jgi:hypothetical protein
MDQNRKFLLHYTADESHSINATVRNRCEAEFLAIAHHIAAVLELDVVIEAEALSEGGVREVWNFVGSNALQLTLIVAVATLVLSRFPPTNAEQDALTKENTKLSNEEKKLQIEKLKNELKQSIAQPSPEATTAAAAAISEDLKIVVRKSNFYRHLIAYPKVNAIGIAMLDDRSRALDFERIISKEDFLRFLTLTNLLPLETVENAGIEIISPVLREGNYKWKGIYQGAPISFSMMDSEFKNDVFREQVSFQHGSVLQCVLHIHQRLDEAGNVVVSGYSVPTVIKKVDGSKVVETAQGHRHKVNRSISPAQGTLFNRLLLDEDI